MFVCIEMKSEAGLGINSILILFILSSTSVKFKFQIRIVLSPLPLTNVLPSGLNNTEETNL
jgi:hypothetical protein